MLVSAPHAWPDKQSEAVMVNEIRFGCRLSAAFETCIQRLAEAAENAETITIVYHGGSQPGTKRWISPIRCSAEGLLARDLKADEIKRFTIEKVEIVAEDHRVPWYEPAGKDHLTPQPMKSLAETLRPHVGELEKMGWFVRLEETSVSIHQRFKNARPKKTAKAGILGFGGEETNKRPWYVFGPGLVPSRTFSYLDRAVVLFLDQARLYAPGFSANTKRTDVREG
jgi:hypothetical protein